MKIPAISLWEPYATAMRLGIKTIETRNKPTSYRGPLAIAATKSSPGLLNLPIPATTKAALMKEVRDRNLSARYEFGCVQCVVMLTDCLRTDLAVLTASELEKTFGDYSPNRYAWVTDPDCLFTLPSSVPARGGQFIWHWEVPLAIQPAIEEMVRNMLVRA